MRRSRLRQVSPKRAAERAERERVVQRALVRADFTCEAAKVWPDLDCRGQLDVHERHQRSIRPGSHLEDGETVVLCRAHHDACHREIERAHELGLLLHSWEDA